METEKDLHASIPVRQAMQRRRSERRRHNLFAYGQQQAEKLGIKEEDVDRIIHELREEDGASNYHDAERQ